MSDNPDVPSNRQDLPNNNNPLVEQAANQGSHSSNPVKQSSGDRPKTEAEADETTGSTKGDLMDKAKGVVDSATGKLGSGGPSAPSN